MRIAAVLHACMHARRPLANYINFRFVPPEQRVLYVNVIAVRAALPFLLCGHAAPVPWEEGPGAEGRPLPLCHACMLAWPASNDPACMHMQTKSACHSAPCAPTLHPWMLTYVRVQYCLFGAVAPLLP